MSSILSGRTALVTGGARRIGAEIVRHLHAAGANVVVHCHRSRDAAVQLCAELDQQRPGSTRVLGADLLDTDALPRLIESSVQAFGRMDLVVNNASSFYPTPFGSVTPEQWADLVGTNLKAPFFLAQAAAPALRASRGLLLNLVDIHGLRPLRDYSVYSAAKAGLVQLTLALARELAPEVRVNAIAPGPILWPETAAPDAARRQQIIERTLLRRMGSPEDIARTVLFFATDAPFITGQVLAVDGGRSIGW